MGPQWPPGLPYQPFPRLQRLPWPQPPSLFETQSHSPTELDGIKADRRRSDSILGHTFS